MPILPRPSWRSHILPAIVLLACLAVSAIPLKGYGQALQEKPLMPAAALAPAPVSDEDVLILALYLDDIFLSDTVLGFKRPDGSLMLALRDFAAATELQITVDDAKGTASGWVLSEDRPFTLNVPEGTVTIGRKDLPLKAGDVEIQNDELFVSEAALASWFPVALTSSFEDLAVKMKAFERFPVQERRAREANISALSDRKPEDRPDYPVMIAEPKRFEIPMLSTNTRLEITRPDQGADTKTLSSTYRLQGVMLDQDVSATINTSALDRSETDVRLTLSRQDPDGTLLGGLEATRYALGDISSSRIPLVTKGESGRGVTLSNMPLNRRGNDQLVTLRGELPVGFQVDLLRNGELLAFQRTPDNNGEYVFENVPAFAGLNEFELVFYGPQGQKRSEKQPIYVDGGSLEKGFLGFTLEAVQQNQNLFSRRVGNDPETGEAQANLQLEYGLTNKAVLYGGVADTPNDTDRVSLYYTGLRAPVGSVLANIYGAMSRTRDTLPTSVLPGGDKSGYAMGGALEGRNFGTAWQVRHDRFENLNSDFIEGDAISGNLAHVTDFRFSNPGRWLGLNVPVSGDFSYEVNDQGQSGNTLSLRTTTSLFSPIRVTTEYNRTAADGVDAESDLTFRLSTPVNKLDIRGEAIYTIAPDPRLSQINLFTDYPVNDRFGVNLSYTRNMPVGGADATETYGGGLNYKFDAFRLGVNMSGTSDGTLSAMTQISSDFGYIPQTGKIIQSSEGFAGSGAVLARAYIDENNDGAFSEGIDQPLEEVGFKGDRIAKEVTTDAEGFLLIKPMTPYTDSLLELDEASLPDPYMSTDKKGYYVRTRPSVISALDFPIYRTGEIDGDVMITTLARGEVPGRNITLQALAAGTQQLAGQTTSAFDGYYLLSQLKLGDYLVQPDPTQMQTLGLCPASPKRALLTKEEQVKTLAPFKLQEAPKPAGSENSIESILMGVFDSESAAMFHRLTLRQSHPDLFSARIFFLSPIEEDTEFAKAGQIALLYGPLNSRQQEDQCTRQREAGITSGCRILEASLSLPPCPPVVVPEPVELEVATQTPPDTAPDFTVTTEDLVSDRLEDEATVTAPISAPTVPTPRSIVVVDDARVLTGKGAPRSIVADNGPFKATAPAQASTPRLVSPGARSIVVDATGYTPAPVHTAAAATPANVITLPPQKGRSLVDGRAPASTPARSIVAPALDMPGGGPRSLLVE